MAKTKQRKKYNPNKALHQRVQQYNSQGRYPDYVIRVVNLGENGVKHIRGGYPAEMLLSKSDVARYYTTPFFWTLEIGYAYRLADDLCRFFADNVVTVNKESLNSASMNKMLNEKFREIFQDMLNDGIHPDSILSPFFYAIPLKNAEPSNIMSELENLGTFENLRTPAEMEALRQAACQELKTISPSEIEGFNTPEDKRIWKLLNEQGIMDISDFHFQSVDGMQIKGLGAKRKERLRGMLVAITEQFSDRFDKLYEFEHFYRQQVVVNKHLNQYFKEEI